MKVFGQSPFDLVDSFLKVQNEPEVKNNIKNKNSLLTASFDISKIYKTNIKLFKSKALSPLVFDWIRTQYFASSEKNIFDKSNSLISKNIDLLSSSELTTVKNGSHYAKSFKSRNCTRQESKLLGCQRLYIITAQNSPEISCKKKERISSFESTFYLTFSKRYGFKIIDVAVSGKRIVLDSMKHLVHLKNKGFNKNAIRSQLTMLAADAKTFKLPRRQISTRKFLAKVRKNSSDRMPSSL